MSDIFLVSGRSVVFALENIYAQRSMLISLLTRTSEISVKSVFVEMGLILKKIFFSPLFHST